MRIVGGRLRGRTLAAPKSSATKSRAIRPTADRLREALFNILVHAYGDPVEGARVLDLFAGTGALGLEALSRGAAFALFVDDGCGGARIAARECRGAGLGRRRPHLPAGRQQARGGASARAVLARLSRSALRTRTRGESVGGGARGGWLVPGALAIVEETVKADFAAPEGFEELERRRYDDTVLIVLRHRG